MSAGDFVSGLQMESVLSDIRIDAQKIGMLGNLSYYRQLNHRNMSRMHRFSQ